MPKIINAYSDANNSIADSLKSIGQSIWGDEAKNEGLRQHAEKLRRENAGRQGASEAFRRGDVNELGAQGILGGMSGGDVGAYGLYGQANRYGAKDPRTTNAWVGAGHNYSGSYPGFEETQAGEMARAQMTADRANASAERTANNTPVAAMGPNGQPGYYSRTEAMGGHLSPVTSKDQEEAMILRRSMAPQGMAPAPGGAPAPPQGAPQPQAPQPGSGQPGPQVAGPGAPAWPSPGTSAPPTPQAPPASPLAGLDGPTLAMFGQPVATAELDRRRRESAMGMKLPPEPTQPSAAQRDIEDTSGAVPLAKGIAGDVLNFWTGMDIRPQQTAALQAANQRVIDTATGLSGTGGLPPSAKGLNIEKGTIPHPSWAGPSAGGDPVQFAKRLRQHWEDTRNIILDPNTTPADREKAYLHLDQLGKTIADWERPRPGAQPAGPTAPAPQQAPQAAPTRVAGAGIPPAHETALAEARDAIAKGVSPDAVMQRLIQKGINPQGL